MPTAACCTPWPTAWRASSPGTDGADYVTQSAHMNFLHNVQSGTLYAAAETVRRGHKLAIFHVTVTDEKGDLLTDGVVDMFRITP